MGDAFRLGGWGMYPTTIAGFMLVCAAIHYARGPSRHALAVVRSLAVVTALTSCLGFVSGVIKCFTSVSGHVLDAIVVVGVGESLCNIGLGLAFLVVAAIGVTVGAMRAGPSRGSGAELADPHAR